ncbi:MAG TPA: flavodoxin domain-containing protein [Polyangiaceae bacterium]|nr:flavodoxin domain-containing protein [Polyangiaceae bacterium]
MANVLVVYATKQGQTEKIARHIAQSLVAAGHASELFDVTHPSPHLDFGRFQFAVVGGPIHAQGYPRALLRFVRQHRAFLERVPAAFFSVGLAVASRTSDGRAQTLPIVQKFLARAGWNPARVELIAGALKYSEYNPLIRLIMRRITAKEGGDTDTSRDYEYTDFAAVERFAREFVGASDVGAAAGKSEQSCCSDSEPPPRSDHRVDPAAHDHARTLLGHE